jgi:hypothetical protein
MEYSKLVAVTGLPGLFELISSRGDGAVVRSLDENKTQFISSVCIIFSPRKHRGLYTKRQCEPVDVFNDGKDGGSFPDAKIMML